MPVHVFAGVTQQWVARVVRRPLTARITPIAAKHESRIQVASSRTIELIYASHEFDVHFFVGAFTSFSFRFDAHRRNSCAANRRRVRQCMQFDIFSC
jgi:hypothetical protein